MSDQFTITEDQKKSFEELKNRTTSPSVIALPRADKPFVLDNDVNAEKQSCVSIQKQDDESLRRVGYFIRTLNDAERNNETTERKYLAIKWALVMLLPYLEGAHFPLRTDYDSLKWIFGPSRNSGKLAYWRLRLYEFSFTVSLLQKEHRR